MNHQKTTTTTTKEIRLSSKGLAQLSHNCYEDDFTFHVGHHDYHCPCWFADFLSPRISHLRCTDMTIRDFWIEVGLADGHGDADAEVTSSFESLLSLSRGESISVKERNLKIFVTLAEKLWNIELIDKIQASFCDDDGEDDDRRMISDMNIASAVSSSEMNCLRGSLLWMDTIIERWSRSFCDMPRSSQKEMKVDLLYSLLSHQSLRITSEDWLYEFVREQIEGDESYYCLLELIRYEYLSQECIEDFTKMITTSYEYLTYPVWLSLVGRLNLSVTPRSVNDRENRKLRQFPVKSDYLDGILSSLSRDIGGNVHDRGLVFVSASSQYWSDCPVQLIVDFNSSLRGYATADTPKSWICIEFKQHLIKPTHYSIRTRTDSDGNHPRSWILEGLKFQDSEDWITLDCQVSNCELTGVNTVRLFSIEKVQEVRSVRLRLTGPNSHNYHHLVLKSIELFGELSDIPSTVQ
jgi:hypothetical protein